MRWPCGWIIAATLVATAAPADAYEFWMRAQTIGQAYQLRSYRLIGPDLFLGRRRFTQTLALRIWDVGDFALDRRIAHLPDRGLRISFQSYLRIDHDFGEYASGRITLPLTVPVKRDALDVIPELADSVASFELLYGYAEVTGLFDDRFTLRVGRVLADDGWGQTGVDGGEVRYEIPQAPLAVGATAGLRVRAASPLGTAAYELDGTSGAACQEYVEGPTPGTGTWKLIDRNRTITNSRLSSDYEYCPQRLVEQPTLGFSIATARVHGFGAELGYRRTWSDTVGLIGSPDRLQFTDLGLYPNDFGQAPSSGVDEHRVWARAHGDLRAGGYTISPYGDLRYSILHAVIDRADAGVRLVHGNHVLEPSVEYFYPTFDGDSIFNVFSIEPTTDLRLAYTFNGFAAVRAESWLRRYAHEDGTSSVAGGVDAGIEHPFGPWRARLDGLYDDGYGGRRAGGSGEAAWHPVPAVWVRGRVIVLDVARDDSSSAPDPAGKPHYVTSSTVASTTWRVADSVAVHAIAELDHDEIHDLQYRAIGVLDFAFAPEP